VTDPLSYEMEYKKRSLWVRKDIESFLTQVLLHPKQFEQVSDHSSLQHKRFQDVNFLYQSMKKHFNLKKYLKLQQASMQNIQNDQV
jgi:hypothetical protein